MNSKIQRNEFLWTLCNYVNHPGGEIESVTLAAGNPFHSLCFIKLFIYVTKSGKRALSHKLTFLPGSYRRGYTYNVCVVNQDGKTKPLPIFNPRKRNCEVLEENFIDGGSITLRCRLTFPYESCEHTSLVKELSMKMGNMMEYKEFSDLELCAGDEVFHVHRFLLQHRCKKLLQCLGIEDNRSRVQVGASSPVLKAILRYIYRGERDSLPVKYHREFYQMAESCEIREFINETIPIQLPTRLCSTIRAMCRKVCWDISTNAAVSGTVPLVKPVILDTDRFFINASVTKVTAGISTDISIRCGINLGEPISVDCIPCIKVDNGDREFLPEKRLQFSPEDTEFERLIVSKHVHGKKLRKDSKITLILTFEYFKCANICSVEDVDLKFESPTSRSIFGMGLLRQDLYDLCNKNMTLDGDIRLQFEDGKLFAHKAIMASSSPVFYNMFQIDTEEIKIKGMDVERGKRLLRYIYSTEVIKKDYLSDLLFVSDLDRFELRHTFENPSTLLASHLTETNACDVLIEADRFKNERLVNEVVDYVCSNRTVILHSKPWISLMGTHPQLVSMVFKNMSSKLGST